MCQAIDVPLSCVPPATLLARLQFDYLAAAVVLLTPGAVIIARAYLRRDLLARMIYLVQAAAWRSRNSSSELLLFEEAWAQAVDTQRSSFELGLLGMSASVGDVEMREQVRTAVFAGEGIESGAVFANGKTVDAIKWVDVETVPQAPILSPVRLRTPLRSPLRSG